jgi:short-subunit dehydrogenase
MLQAKSVAVITGATAGIGRAYAEQLARRGHSLLLIARDEARLSAIAAELTRTHGVGATVLRADLSDEADIGRVADLLAARQDIGILVNNAGFGTQGKLHVTDLEPQIEMVRLHVMAPMRLTRAVLPAMIAQGSGWIINVSSIAGFMYSAGNVNYCATKAYVTRFTEALDTELVGTGVVVQALCPGFTRSEFHSRASMDMKMVPGYLWKTSDDVAAISIAAADRGRPVVVIPGLTFRVIRRLIGIMPHWVMRRGRNALKRA